MSWQGPHQVQQREKSWGGTTPCSLQAGQAPESYHLTLDLPWFRMEFAFIELSIFTFFMILKSIHDILFLMYWRVIRENFMVLFA